MYQVLSQIIRDFLIENKSVSLEKIGVLRITSGTISLENGENIPQTEYEYDKRVDTTPELIDYAVERLKKNPSIVRSDIEYFLEESRQLMNIGSSPLIIEGIGYIYAKKQGGYAFSQESVAALKDLSSFESPYDTKIKDKTVAASVNDGVDEKGSRFQLQDPYSAEVKKKSLVNVIAILIGLLILVAIGYGVYYFMSHRDTLMHDETVSSQVDSANISEPLADTSRSEVDTQTAVATPVAEATEGYRFEFERTLVRSRAESRIAKLRSYGDPAGFDSIDVKGVKNYRLFITISDRNIDTTRAKDSLFKYFQKPISIIE